MAENVVQMVQESGTGKKVMVIEIARFLQRTYANRKHEKNQGIFVVKCFLSAGSHHFELPEKYKQKSTELETARMLMKEDTNHRRLTDTMKKSFPAPLDKGLAEYLSEDVSDEQLRKALTELGITISTEANVQIYGLALYDQFQLFIDSNDPKVEDIVAKRYMERLKEAGVEESPDVSVGKYVDDRMAVFKSARGFVYEINCEESFKHEWMIRNAGKIPWKNRKLKMINQADVRPRPAEEEIIVPDTAPGDIAKVSVEIDGRGFEGTYVCKWIMADPDGVNCFPDDNDLDVTVISTFEI
ncbi:MAG: hypothetical protein IJL20_10275 [Lachnospiraceae bacterium]|nr:hypothetical protein [Lachnospiraceae bacterium]